MQTFLKLLNGRTHPLYGLLHKQIKKKNLILFANKRSIICTMKFNNKDDTYAASNYAIIYELQVKIELYAR